MYRDEYQSMGAVRSLNGSLSIESPLRHGNDPTDSHDLAVPAHPWGLMPSGNAYLSRKNLKVAAGHFAILPDETLVQLLEHFTERELVQLGSTCKALFAFCRLEDFWKAFVVG